MSRAADRQANGVTSMRMRWSAPAADFRPCVIICGAVHIFTADEDERKLKVAVLGSGLAKTYLARESALGQTITVGSTKLTGYRRDGSKGVVADIDYDGRVYLPDQCRLSEIYAQPVDGLGCSRDHLCQSASQAQDTSVTPRLQFAGQAP